MEWRDSDSLNTGGNEKAHRDNIYRYPEDEHRVSIKLGSIHSVKGQTHTATLVLETFWKKHNLESLKEWLLGGRRHGPRNGSDETRRLRLHYVAMTRPTHLLCLAMKRNAFSDDEVTLLEGRGWRIVFL